MTGARAQHDDALPEIHSLVNGMRHEQLRVALLVPKLEQGVLQLLAQERIECGEWLVHEQQVDIEGDGARQGKTLLHATGKLTGISMREIREADEAQGLARLRLALLAVNAAHLEAKFGVGEHRLPGQ